MSGAPEPDELVAQLASCGFACVRLEAKAESAEFIKDWLPGSGAERYVTAAYVTATKPLPLPLKLAARVARWLPALLAAFAADVVDACVRVALGRALGLRLPESFLRAALAHAHAHAPEAPEAHVAAPQQAAPAAAVTLPPPVAPVPEPPAAPRASEPASERPAASG